MITIACFSQPRCPSPTPNQHLFTLFPLAIITAKTSNPHFQPKPLVFSSLSRFHLHYHHHLQPTDLILALPPTTAPHLPATVSQAKNRPKKTPFLSLNQDQPSTTTITKNHSLIPSSSLLIAFQIDGDKSRRSLKQKNEISLKIKNKLNCLKLN
jgi:hypothetical protein